MRWRIAGLCGALAFALAVAVAGNANESKESEMSAKQQAGEMADDTAEYVSTQRERLEEQAEEARDDLQREISEARDKLADLSGEARQEVQTAIGRGEKAEDALGKQLDDLQRSTSQSWETAKERLSAAADEANEARKEIAAALSGDEK